MYLKELVQAVVQDNRAIPVAAVQSQRGGTGADIPEAG